MSKDWVTDIADMHDKFDFRKNLKFNGAFLEFRKKFLEEELEELNNSIISADPQSVVDAIIDLCVVAIGTLDLAYVDVHKAWDEVLKKNLEKEKGHNSTRAGSEGFDLIKPDGWTPPDHTGNTGYLDVAVTELCDARLPIQPLASHIETMVEYVDFAKSKNHDYNGDDPEFQHAAYYPNGINDIVYEISKKVKRIRRGIKRFLDHEGSPRTESLEDSFRDINIYSAIGATYLRGNLEGQSSDRDMLNREKDF